MLKTRDILKSHLPILFFWGMLFLAVLPFVEMRASDEAIIAGVARDIIQNHHFIPAEFQFQGRPCVIFPLYPWLEAIFSWFGEPTAFTVRLPSALAALALTMLAGKMARRYKSDPAGLAAALTVLTSFVMIRVGYRAHTETLHAMLMTGAWFTWYNLGPQRHRWSLAWCLALACVFLDLMNVGMRCVLLFYLPLLFTRMPPRVQRRLLQPAHLFWFLSFALIAYVWLTLGKQPIFGGGAQAASPMTSFGDEGFFHHLLVFPCKVFCYLLPWGLLAWAPFCEAQRRFEPAGSLCGFLRAVVLWPSLGVWLLPGTSPLLLLPMLAPVAVLIGIHSEIVLHRNARFFHRLARWGGYLAAAAMLLLACGWMLVDWGTIRITPAHELAPILSPIALSRLARGMEILLLTVAGLTLWRTRQGTDAGRLAWCAFGCFFTCYLGFKIPLDYLLMPDRVYAAKALLGALPDITENRPDNLAGSEPGPATRRNNNETLTDLPHVYLETTEAIAEQLNGQMYYLGLPVTHIQNLPAELPSEQSEVWLLSQKFPLYANWTWDPVSPEYNLNQLRQIQVTPLNPKFGSTEIIRGFFHGGIQCTKVNYEFIHTETPLPRYRPPAKFRLYHGSRNFAPAE